LENLNDPRSRDALATNRDLLENYPMSFRRYSLFCLLSVAIGAASAATAETAQPLAQAPLPTQKTKPPLKAPKHADMAKVNAKKTDTSKSPVSEGNMRDPIFSDPGVPVMSSTKSPVPATAAPSAKGASVAPGSGPSLDLKWHATSDPNDPYDGTARHTSGSEGPGNAVLGGIKFGF
jgi:hypothetical protein